MRIIFMGTPDFAVPSLEVLVEEHDVVAVVTQPDRRSGRGQRLRPSPVKEAALKHGLTVLQPEKVGVPEVMDELEAYGADLFVVVAFGQKLPDRLLEMPKYGCVNVHSSLCPSTGGCSHQRRDSARGLCHRCHHDVHGFRLGYGDIILQAEEPILPRDTAGALHDRLMVKGAELLRETVRQIAAGNAPRKPQDHGAASYAFKLSKDDSYVDFKEPADRLDRLIRGMNPWPLAYTYVGEETVKIHEALPSDASGAPGEILALEGQGLLVGCGLGSLLLLKVQRPNAKAVSGVDFANGLRLRVGDYL